MAKLKSIGKLPTGIAVLGERNLVCQTGGSNKFYTGVFAQDQSTGEFIAGARYGRIGGSQVQTVAWYRGGSRAQAENAVRTMLEDKVYKGRSTYVTEDGLSLTPLFNSAAHRHPHPAPPGPPAPAAPVPTAPAALAAPAARPVASMRDAMARRRGQ